MNTRSRDTNTAEPAPDALRLQLVEVAARFVQAFDRWLRRCRPEEGISWSRLQLLGLLICHGPQKMSDIGDALGVTPRNITTLVDALEREGLVTRRPHPTDRRVTLIALTPKAATCCAALWSERHAAASEFFASLSEADQRELLRLLQLLLASPALA
jgi:DNA-binding MarR family transcriptional regulator